MLEETNIEAAWDIILNYIRSPHQNQQGYLRILSWMAKMEMEINQHPLILQIKFIQHQLSVALTKYSEASQILNLLPEFETWDLTPLLAVGITIPLETRRAYLQFLAANGCNLRLAEGFFPEEYAQLTLYNELDPLFLYMKNVLFNPNSKEVFNFDTFKTKLMPHLIANKITSRSKKELVNFFNDFYARAQQNPSDFFRQDNGKENFSSLMKLLEGEKVEDKPSIAEDLQEFLPVANWFDHQKFALKHILVTYPVLISCILKTDKLEYVFALLDLFEGDDQSFIYLIKPISKAIQRGKLEGKDYYSHNSSPIKPPSSVRIFFFKYYGGLYKYLCSALENLSCSPDLSSLQAIIELSLLFTTLSSLLPLGRLYLKKIFQIYIHLNDVDSFTRLYQRCVDKKIKLAPLAQAEMAFIKLTHSLLTIGEQCQAWDELGSYFNFKTTQTHRHIAAQLRENFIEHNSYGYAPEVSVKILKCFRKMVVKNILEEEKLWDFMRNLCLGQEEEMYRALIEEFETPKVESSSKTGIISVLSSFKKIPAPPPPNKLFQELLTMLVVICRDEAIGRKMKQEHPDFFPGISQQLQ